MQLGARQRLRGWRKWALGATVALAVYALVGFLVVPQILSRQIVGLSAEHLRRRASVERVRFNPFSLVAEAEGLRLVDLDGSDLLTVERLRVNLEVSGVFRRALRLGELRVERPVAAIRVLEGAALNIADLLQTPAEPPEPSRPMRLIVDELTLIAGAIHFSDLSREPPYEARFEPLELTAKDLRTLPEESGEHSITVAFGRGASFRWTGRHTVEPLEFTGRLDVTGLDLAEVWKYAGYGHPLVIASGRADLELPYAVRSAADRPLELQVQDAVATLTDVLVQPRGIAEDWLAVPGLTARDVDVEWPAARASVGAIHAEQPKALVRVADNGSVNWALAVPAREPDASGSRFRFECATFDIEGGSVRFQDRTTEPDVAVELADAAVRLEGLSNDPSVPVKLDVSARVYDTGTLAATGTVVASPLDATIAVDLAGIDLPALRPYRAVLPGAQLASGRAGVKGVAKLAGNPVHVSFEGAAHVDEVELQVGAGERLIAWDHLAIDGLRTEAPPVKVRIRSIGVERPFAKLHIDREGQVNIAKLTAGERAQPDSTAPRAAVEIGVLDLRNATIDFTDESLVLPFGTQIHGAQGKMRDLSTFSSAPASLVLEGRVDETGSVKVDGTVRLADPYASTDVGVGFRHVDMGKLTPYAAEFAGYSIENGLLDLDVHYRIADRRLVGDHRVVATDLVLGPKVEGSSGAGLPVRLAIALLKDKQGRIDLEVPVEGTIDSPEFAYRKVFWQAFKKILTNVAAAPFRALGHLFGGDAADLELVEFDAGRSDLLPDEQDKLSRIAAELAPRTELTVDVEGRFDPLSDSLALQRAKLQSILDARRAELDAASGAGGGATMEAVLESLYAERFTAETLAAERTRFTPPTTAAFDAAGFYEALLARLLESETVSDGELAALAEARAQAIVAALGVSMDTSRLAALPATPVKRKKAGSDRIASEMMLSAREP